jgi:hypothetical protein
MNGCGIRGYSLKVAVINIGILGVVIGEAIKNNHFSPTAQTGLRLVVLRDNYPGHMVYPAIYKASVSYRASNAKTF